jgi:EmrB/QacA subfamily drug resistance transporter
MDAVHAVAVTEWSPKEQIPVTSVLRLRCRLDETADGQSNPMTSAPATTASGRGGGAPDGDGDYTPDPRRWKALTVCLVAGFMTLLDVSIVNVALPSIQKGIGAGENALSWVVSGYALAFGLLLVPAGRVGDARGRRPAFIAGLALFTAASAACGFAPSAGVLIAARLVQGFAGGVVTPQVSGLIQSLFRGKERAKAFGMYGATVGISTAVGPLVGGALIAAFGQSSGWRYVFFVNVPIGLAAIPLARALIPHAARDPTTAARADYDPVGVVLLGIAVLLVILPFIEQQTWHSPIRPLLFPAAAVMFALFLRWESRYRRRQHEPVVDFSLFTRPSYSYGAGVGLLYFAGFTGIFFIYAQVLQDGFHYSALESGLAFIPFALGSAATAALGGRIVSRLGRPLVVAGLAMVIVGVLGTVLAVHEVDSRGIGIATAAPLLLAGLGSGFVITPNITLTLSQVPVRRAGVAGGVLQTGQRIGSAAGIAICGSVYYGALGAKKGYADALDRGLLVIGAFVVVALALALVDAVTGRAAHPQGEHQNPDAHTQVLDAAPGRRESC